MWNLWEARPIISWISTTLSCHFVHNKLFIKLKYSCYFSLQPSSFLFLLLYKTTLIRLLVKSLWDLNYTFYFLSVQKPVSNHKTNMSHCCSSSTIESFGREFPTLLSKLDNFLTWLPKTLGLCWWLGLEPLVKLHLYILSQHGITLWFVGKPIGESESLEWVVSPLTNHLI